MPRFFIRQNQIEEENGKRLVKITGEDSHHISRALRMAVGEKIEVVDMQKNLYICELNGFFDSYVVAHIIEEKKGRYRAPPFYKAISGSCQGGQNGNDYSKEH